jgi:hypothetical protein
LAAFPKSQVEITRGLFRWPLVGRSLVFVLTGSGVFKNHAVEARKEEPRNFRLLNISMRLLLNLG